MFARPTSNHHRPTGSALPSSRSYRMTNSTHTINLNTFAILHTKRVGASKQIIAPSLFPIRSYSINQQQPYRDSLLPLSEPVTKDSWHNYADFKREFKHFSIPAEIVDMAFANLQKENVEYAIKIIWTLMNCRKRTKEHYLQLFQTLFNAEQLRRSDLRGLCLAIECLGRYDRFTLGDFKLLLDKLAFCADIQIAVMRLESLTLLDRNNFYLLLNRAPDIFYPLRFIFERFPKELANQSNFDRILRPRINNKDLVIIFSELERYGLITQANLDEIYDYQCYSTTVRLMLEHMPLCVNRQLVFTRMMNVIINIDYILKHGPADMSQDAKRQLCHEFYANLDLVPVIADQIRKTILPRMIIDDLSQFVAKNSLLGKQKLSTSFSLFQSTKKTSTSNALLELADREAQEKVGSCKPKC